MRECAACGAAEQPTPTCRRLPPPSAVLAAPLVRVLRLQRWAQLKPEPRWPVQQEPPPPLALPELQPPVVQERQRLLVQQAPAQQELQRPQAVVGQMPQQPRAQQEPPQPPVQRVPQQPRSQ